MDKPICRDCGNNEFVELGRVIFQNGSDHYAWHCFWCDIHGTCAGKPWLKRDEVLEHLNGRPPHALPLLFDHRANPCVVCGALGTELHHWAPYSLSDLFGDDWARWPTAYLCRKHHAIWHDIVTPAMPGRHDPSLAGEALRRWEK